MHEHKLGNQAIATAVKQYTEKPQVPAGVLGGILGLLGRNRKHTSAENQTPNPMQSIP
jgi:hypothetical protein